MEAIKVVSSVDRCCISVATAMRSAFWSGIKIVDTNLHEHVSCQTFLSKCFVLNRMKCDTPQLSRIHLFMCKRCERPTNMITVLQAFSTFTKSFSPLLHPWSFISRSPRPSNNSFSTSTFVLFHFAKNLITGCAVQNPCSRTKKIPHKNRTDIWYIIHTNAHYCAQWTQLVLKLVGFEGETYGYHLV